MKPTKRLGFTFLRSYFDVLNKIENDADKLNFLLSIINKQFLDEDPKDLTFMVELCYESQRHAIEKSVKGWKTANKTDLKGDPILPKGSPLPPPSIPPPTPPPKEEEEKEQEKEKEETNTLTESEFLELWKAKRKKHLNKPTNIPKLSPRELTRLTELKKDYTPTDIKNAMEALFRQEVLNFSSMTLRPQHFLDKFEIYFSAYSERNTTLYGSKPVKPLL